jgi:hypothetical protein
MKFIVLLLQELRNEFCRHMIHAKILHQNLWNNSPWNPQIFL